MIHTSLPHRMPHVSIDCMLFAIAHCRNSGTRSSGTKTVFRPASPVLVKWSINGLQVRSTSGPGRLYTKHTHRFPPEHWTTLIFMITLATVDRFQNSWIVITRKTRTFRNNENSQFTGNLQLHYHNTVLVIQLNCHYTRLILQVLMAFDKVRIWIPRITKL